MYSSSRCGRANLNIDKNSRVRGVIDSIMSVPLLRQFGVYPDVSMFPPKIVTDDLIQRQYLGGGGLVQTTVLVEKRHYSGLTWKIAKKRILCVTR